MHKSTTSILGKVRSRSLTQGRGHTLRSWDSVAGDLAVLQTAVWYFASLMSAVFLFFLNYPFSKEIFRYKQVWIQILSVLILVQTVYKGHQQMIKVVSLKSY